MADNQITDIELQKLVAEYSIEKLPLEPLRAYTAFLSYINLSFKERQKWLGILSKDLGLPTMMLNAWKDKYDWEKRTELIEAKRQIKNEVIREREVQSQMKQIVDNNKEVQARITRMGRQVLDVLEDFAKNILPKRIDKITNNEYCKMMNDTVKNMRLVSDLPTDIVESRILSPEELENMSVEEVQAFFESKKENVAKLSAMSKLEDSSDMVM